MSAQLSYYYKNRDRILQQQKIYYQINKHNMKQYQRRSWKQINNKIEELKTINIQNINFMLDFGEF
jgi:hypothetical protein